MASQKLTTKQCLLLQRFYDKELSAAQSVQAEQLLERSAAARVFVQALAELGMAARSSHELLWQRVEPQMASAAQVARLAELARDADQMLEEPLEDLTGLLTRVHDGEADPAEVAWARALLAQRPDAQTFMDELEAAGASLRQASEEAAEDVDFSDFWSKVSAGIDAQTADISSPKTPPATKNQGENENKSNNTPILAFPSAKVDLSQAFEADDHLMLLHRFADGEARADEIAQVQAWVDQEQPEVMAFLGALDEIKLGVSVAIDTLIDQAPLRELWPAVDEAISEIAQHGEQNSANWDDLGSGDRPVSLSEAREKRRGWAREYRQAIFGAVAAAVVLAGMVGLFKDQIFSPNERVIVEKTIEKRVVIVESVEYSPGASVKIDGAAKQVNMPGARGKKAQDGDAEGEPTVIWLFDETNEPEGVFLDDLELEDGDETEAKPAEEQPSSPDSAPDAGQHQTPRGQPI